MFRNTRSDRRGGIAVLVAVSLVVLVGFVALALDIGLARVKQVELQAVVDASAAAAATGVEVDATEAQERAVATASANRLSGQPFDLDPADVQVGTWGEGGFMQDPDGDTIRVRAPHSIPTHFAGIIGFDVLDVSAEAIVVTDAAGAAGGCGVLGGDDLDLDGNVLIDSYDSSEAPYGGTNVNANASSCSNGDVSVSGSVEVWGDARPGVGESVTVSGSAYVDGSIDPLEEEVVMPEVDLAYARSNNDNAASGLGPEPDVKLSGDETLEIGPGTIYMDSIRMSGKATIEVVPPVDLYVAGDVKLSGQGIVNESKNPHDLTILSGGDSVRMSGKSEFYGSVIAPDADIRVSGTADYFGVIAGHSTTFTGTMKMHMDESLPEQWGLDLPAEVDTWFVR